MSFQAFDRAGHRALSARILNALGPLADELDLDFSGVGGQIGTTDLTIKIKATTRDKQTLAAKEKAEFAAYARYVGLEPDDYGLEFQSMAGRYRLTAIAPSRPKFPILGVCLRTGKTYKFTKATVAAIVQARQLRDLARPIATPGLTAKPAAPVEQGDDAYATAAVWG